MTFQFDLQNIIDHEGVAISLVGMSIVFTGLVLVSLFILVLPRVLASYDRLRGKGDSERAEDSPDREKGGEREAEILAAIGTVIEMALAEDDGTAHQRITIRRTQSDSFWREVGQMRSLSSKPPF